MDRHHEAGPRSLSSIERVFLSAEPSNTSLRAVVAKVASGELSPLELTEEFLGRIASVEGRVKAFRAIDPEGALNQARALTEALARGASPACSMECRSGSKTSWT
jgi:hypothetical protein